MEWIIELLALGGIMGVAASYIAVKLALAIAGFLIRLSFYILLAAIGGLLYIAG